MARQTDGNENMFLLSELYAAINLIKIPRGVQVNTLWDF